MLLKAKPSNWASRSSEFLEEASGVSEFMNTTDGIGEAAWVGRVALNGMLHCSAQRYATKTAAAKMAADRSEECVGQCRESEEPNVPSDVLIPNKSRAPIRECVGQSTGRCYYMVN